MDENSDHSSPSKKTDQKRGETESVDGMWDGPSPGEDADEDWTFMTQAHYDPEERRDLTTVIIGAIAEAEGVPMIEIRSPPLYEVVDIASIEDALFGRPDANRDGTTSTVESRYNQYKVSVEADGWVTVSGPSQRTLADRDRS